MTTARDGLPSEVPEAAPDATDLGERKELKEFFQKAVGRVFSLPLEFFEKSHDLVWVIGESRRFKGRQNPMTPTKMK